MPSTAYAKASYHFSHENPPACGWISNWKQCKFLVAIWDHLEAPPVTDSKVGPTRISSTLDASPPSNIKRLSLD